ncbi:trypsin-1-like [Penaeus japonicus]|uniref:trypsin-1-like n=1 Tax=Penaeus japonicus TaxID=27405 RepID=UPI001C70FB69|nr:trypsin-1-like [Penaeus japonicus]
MDDQVSLHQGRTIELTYERRVMGFNGGYVCTVSCLGSPPAPPPESAGCPTCGVTVDMEAKGGGVRADHRIVGGQSTVKGAYPWAAHLKISEQPSMEYRCGGSLVTNKLVVTAAHCLSGDNIQHIDVTLGMVDTRIVIASDMVRMRSSDFVIHPEYDEMTLYNDIAVIHLPEAVTFTDNIRPLCLPSSEESMEGKVATAIGWGTLQFYGKEALVLQEVDLDVWSNADCKNVWSRDKYGMLIGSSQVCALRDGKDTCSGDSGGPLMVQENGKYQLHGITSFGQGCATPGIPGVYTRASSYVTWIESFISEDYCQNG